MLEQLFDQADFLQSSRDRRLATLLSVNTFALMNHGISPSIELPQVLEFSAPKTRHSFLDLENSALRKLD